MYGLSISQSFYSLFSFLDDIPTIIQQVDNSKFISKFDVKAAYHHFLVKPDDRWLTAFVYDNQVYQ